MKCFLSFFSSGCKSAICSYAKWPTEINFFRSIWYLRCYHNAMKRWNTFCRMPTTSDMRIGHLHQTLDGYNSRGDTHTVRFRIRVFVSVDCKAMQINHNNIQVWHSHLEHSNQISLTLPSDSICPEYYRRAFLSVYCISLKLAWNASFALPLTRSPLATDRPSMMALSILSMMSHFLRNYMIKFNYFMVEHYFGELF